MVLISMNMVIKMLMVAKASVDLYRSGNISPQLLDKPAMKIPTMLQVKSNNAKNRL